MCDLCNNNMNLRDIEANTLGATEREGRIDYASRAVRPLIHSNTTCHVNTLVYGMVETYWIYKHNQNKD